MKSLLVVLCFCFILAPILKPVQGNSGSEEEEEDEVDVFGELRERLDTNGAIINGALQVTPDGYLGEGGYGLVYKGIRLNDSRPVAVKFIDSMNDESAEREYSIYAYLYAIDTPNVERFGIPSVYYYAQWEDFIVMAITLCEGSLDDRKNDFVFPINALIVFQQFVRQSKYIHSCGIRHDDIKPENIMIRTYQTFLIDYNLGSEMNDDTHLCTYKYKPRRSHLTNQNRKAVDDWESFFYAMADVCDVPLKWFSGDEYKNLSEEELNRKYGQAKRSAKEIIDKVKTIESEPLKNVFMAFAREIFGKDAADYPKYDWMDQYITHQIQSLLGPNQPLFWTWMERGDIKTAFKHIRKNPIPTIQDDIMNPMMFNYNYPQVDYNYFNSTAGSSGHY